MGTRRSLNQYIEEVRDTPFEWGVHDCFTFTNNAFKAMFGRGWADDWVGRYMQDGRPMRKQALKAEFKASQLEYALDKKLTRISHVPPLGALVATKHNQTWVTGAALGICDGTKGLFLSKNGITALSIDDLSGAWSL